MVAFISGLLVGALLMFIIMWSIKKTPEKELIIDEDNFTPGKEKRHNEKPV